MLRSSNCLRNSKNVLELINFWHVAFQKHHHNTTASWFDGRHPTTSSNITGLFNWLLLCAFTRLSPFAVFLTHQSKPIFSYHFDVIIPENLELIKNRISVKLVRQYRDNAARIKNFWSISVGNTATGPRFFRSVPYYEEGQQGVGVKIRTVNWQECWVESNTLAWCA